MKGSFQQALFSAASLLTIGGLCEPASAQTAPASPAAVPAQASAAASAPVSSQGSAQGQTPASTTAASAAPSDASAASSATEIVVTGVRASMRDAIAQKRINTEIVETISSKDIGALPDVTIADELDRLPGVNATRDRGNDSQAAVRGLGPRLVLGLVNGREVASSEPDRNVRWEIYPSEDVSGVTVYKTQAADLIAGGVAATIDIRTLRPLDYSGPALTLRLGPLYNTGGSTIPGYSPWGLRGSAEYVAKISDTLAVSVGGSYQKQQNGYVSFQGWGYNTPSTGSPPTLNGVVTNTPWGAQTEVDAVTEQRASVTGAAQWKPNSHLQVNFDILYSDVSINEYQNEQYYGRNGTWSDYGGNNANSGDAYNAANGSSYTVVNGDVVGATLPYSSVTNVIAHYREDKTLFATGLNGVWTQDDWTLKGDVSYSEASRTNRWQAIFTESYPATTTFYTGAGSAPSVVTSSDPSNPQSQYTAQYLYGESDGPVYLNDALGAIQADLSRTLHGDFFTGVDFGGRFSNRIKGQRYYQWYEQPLEAQIPSSMLSEYAVKGLNVPDILTGNFNQIANSVVGGFHQPDDAFLAADYWRVHEYDGEAYAKVDFAHDILGVPMTGNAGVRVVSVKTTSDGYQELNDSGVYTPVTEGDNYTQALPSLNLNFALTDDTKLRFGLARVMARPPLDELRAGRTLNIDSTGVNTGSAGNPKLSPFLANQADLSYEWYFHPESLAAVAVYYKDVETNIGYKTDTETIDGENYVITGPFNGKGGRMDGVEFTFQTPFYFIPYLEHFGVYSNLALADSDIKEFTPVNNPLPMVGLARTTAEVDLWYSQFGLDARLGYKYHSPFTVIYGWDASQLTRLQSENILGFSLSYQLTHNMSVRFQANNLTDQISRYTWDNGGNELARYDNYGRSYLLDFTVKY